MPLPIIIFAAVAFTSITAGFGGPGSFAETNWIPGRSGTWNTPANWDSPSPPRTGDEVRLGGEGSRIELRGSTNQLGSLRIEKDVDFRITSGSFTTRREGPVRCIGGKWSIIGGQAVIGGITLIDGTTRPSVLSLRNRGHLQARSDLELNGNNSRLEIIGHRTRFSAKRLVVRSGQPTLAITLDDPETFQPLTLSDGLHFEPQTGLRLSLDVSDFAPRYGQSWIILQSGRVLDFTFLDPQGAPIPHGTILRIRGVPFSILYGRGIVALKVLEERNGTLHGFPGSWPDGLIR